MTERQIKALNNLYIATIEVMDSFAPDMVDSAKRRESVARLLENFLVGASSNSHIRAVDNITWEAEGNKEVNCLSECTPPSDQPAKPVEPIAMPEVERPGYDDEGVEIRFVEGPVDGAFKRPKTKEDKESIIGRALSEGNPVPRFNYRLYLTDESHGTFELIGGGKDDIKSMMSGYDVTEGVTELTPDSVAWSSASFVETVERGQIEKEGKRWQVNRKAKIRYKA